MRKYFLLLVSSFLFLSVSAQERVREISAWYGVSYATIETSHEKGGKADHADWGLKPLNLGVNMRMNSGAKKYDTNIGLGILTKGSDGWTPVYLQAEYSSFYNFVHKENLRIGIGAGGFAAFALSTDKLDDCRKFDAGLILGFDGAYKEFTFRVGVEGGLVPLVKDSGTKNMDIFARIGYTLFNK